MSLFHEVYLHLGSNLGDREAMLQRAESLIVSEIGPIRQRSRLYETEPWGEADQPYFINQAILVSTKLSPIETLEAIHRIEATCGRVRSLKWSARVLDIDLIFYEDEIINSKDLKVPHPYMQDRNFVLIPMMDIASDFVHPVLERSMDELYDHCSDSLEVILLENE